MHATSHTRTSGRLASICALLALTSLSPVQAYVLHADADTRLDLNVQLAASYLHSQENYLGGPKEEGSSTWQEGYIRYGLTGSQRLAESGSSLYGGINNVSSGTFGDGDAGGYTDGKERRTKIDRAYLGWRSGQHFTSLGEDGVDISFGSQQVPIGDGFLINGDGTSMGNGFAGGLFDRGGNYYLGARNAFNRTAVLRLGGLKGWRSDLMWFKSDNRFRSKAEVAVGTLEHVGPQTTWGLTYVEILDIDEDYAIAPFMRERDGTKTYSLRGKSNAGLDNLFLSFEHAWQEKPSSDEKAWYVEAGWTFSDQPWRPYLSYRHTHYSDLYESLFSGFSRGIGTWQQGSVATNFSGPFKRNAAIHLLNLNLSPRTDLKLGAQYFNFSTLDRRLGNLSGRELDLYMNWSVTPRLTLLPMLSVYKPEKSAGEGGLQIGNTDTNLFTQLMLFYNF